MESALFAARRLHESRSVADEPVVLAARPLSPCGRAVLLIRLSDNEHMRILVIEDDPDLLFVVACTLREEGYAVDTAEDGDEGLFKATSWDYDAVVLDIMLPKLDGWSLLERLRRMKAIPVLMLTAKDRVSDRVRGSRRRGRRLPGQAVRADRAAGPAAGPHPPGGRQVAPGDRSQRRGDRHAFALGHAAKGPKSS